MECVRPGALDVDFGYRQILIRDTKGKKDPVVAVPENIHCQRELQIEKIRDLHSEDLESGFGQVFPSGALAKKYPNGGGSSFAGNICSLRKGVDRPQVWHGGSTSSSRE